MSKTAKKKKTGIDRKADLLGTFPGKLFRDTMPRRKAVALVVIKAKDSRKLDFMPRLLARMADGEEIDLGVIWSYSARDNRWGAVTITLEIPGVDIKGSVEE
jgi:hypothetical protein